MRPITINLGGIKDTVVSAALAEVQRASYDTLQNDPSTSGTAIATMIGATLTSGGPEIPYFVTQYTTGYLPLSINGISALLPLRIRLGANTTFNVTTAGNDSTGNGSVGSPWLTIQHAINVIQNNIDLNGFTATIQVAAGTYAGFTLFGPWTGGSASVSGDLFAPVLLTGDTTTPANVIINSVITLSGYAALDFQGFQTTGSAAILSSRHSVFNITGNCTFASTGVNQLGANQFGMIRCLSSYSIGGASPITHWGLNNSAQLIYSSITITVIGAPAYSSAFITAGKCSTTNLAGITFSPAASVSGPGTGPKYSVVSNAVIDTGGGGANYFPGDSAGATAAGGQYL